MAPIRTWLQRVLAEVAAVVLAVKAHRINDDTALEPSQAHRLSVEWVHWQLRQMRGHEIIQALRPAVVRPAVALGGQHQDAAAQAGLIPMKGRNQFFPIEEQ